MVVPDPPFPTRDQLSAAFNGDERMIRTFERLFERVGVDLSGEITANAAAITVNAGDIATNTGAIAANASAIVANSNSISANAGNISVNAGLISANAVQIASARALAWLGM